MPFELRNHEEAGDTQRTLLACNHDTCNIQTSEACGCKPREDRRGHLASAQRALARICPARRTRARICMRMRAVSRAAGPSWCARKARVSCSLSQGAWGRISLPDRRPWWTQPYPRVSVVCTCQVIPGRTCTTCFGGDCHCAVRAIRSMPPPSASADVARCSRPCSCERLVADEDQRCRRSSLAAPAYRIVSQAELRSACSRPPLVYLPRDLGPGVGSVARGRPQAN